MRTVPASAIHPRSESTGDLSHARHPFPTPPQGAIGHLPDPIYLGLVNSLLDPGHIALWLLLAGLFFPRLALVLAWLVFGGYPPNHLSDLANFFLWLLVPRFLMAYYVYVNMGTHNIWFWAYVITGFIALFGEPHYVRRRAVRRTTVTRANGATTTTVEDVVP